MASRKVLQAAGLFAPCGEEAGEAFPRSVRDYGWDSEPSMSKFLASRPRRA